MTALSIRAATELDLPAVLRLYAQPDLDDGKVLDVAAARKIFTRFARYPNYTLYVAEQDGAIVGSFALLIMDNLGHLGAPSGVVEDVAVDPAWQSRGVGSAMLRFAREQCALAGCYKMALSSNLKRSRAHRFYEGQGLVQHGLSFVVDVDSRA